ncbi:MAG: AAA family ATPase [Proteobacteria bacterium]|nr:AAA family ATPase [Pseudomonadota bacterium]
MNDTYRAFFELQMEPFRTDIVLSEIMETHDLLAVHERFDYAVRLGAIALVTGEIGSGKSTALRYATGHLHPSEYVTLCITASSGSILEIYRQILDALGIDVSSASRAVMTRRIRKEISDIVHDKKMKSVLVIDEASLLRLDVFAEIHTLCQFQQDSKAWLPVILAGQSNLIDKLMYRGSQPLASRIVARSHLEGVDRRGMEEYLVHHLAIAGIKKNIFDDAAVTAIHQGSGGLFRKANHLARGALIAAAKEQSMIVTAEHVRLAATEIF